MLTTAGMHDIVLTILAILVIIIIGGSIYALFAAIFNFIFAGGDQEKVKSGYNSIRYMIIGLLFTLFVLLVFPLLFKWMNVPSYELFTPRNIFARVMEIFQYLFKLGGMVRNTSGLFDGGGLDTVRQSGEYSL